MNFSPSVASRLSETIHKLSEENKTLREENKNLKAKLKKEKAISELAEDCVYDIEDALYRGEKNDWATAAIDEFTEALKELKGE